MKPTQAEWTRDVPGFFAADQVWLDGRCHLVVERLPGSGWDWVVWASKRSNRCLYGTADTAESAKRAAEHAAMALRRPQPIVLVRKNLALHRAPATLN